MNYGDMRDRATLTMGMCAPKEVYVNEATRDSEASNQLKALYSISERLDNLSLNLNDKLKPISRNESECSQTGIGHPECQLPPYFEEMKSIVRRLHAVAERLEGIYDRCEI